MTVIITEPTQIVVTNAGPDVAVTDAENVVSVSGDDTSVTIADDIAVSVTDEAVSVTVQDQLVQVLVTNVAIIGGGAEIPQSKTLTYDNGRLVRVDNEDGTFKELSYIDGVLHTVYDGQYTKTMIYTDGILTAVNVTTD